MHLIRNEDYVDSTSTASSNFAIDAGGSDSHPVHLTGRAGAEIATVTWLATASGSIPDYGSISCIILSGGHLS